MSQTSPTPSPTPAAPKLPAGSPIPVATPSTPAVPTAPSPSSAAAPASGANADPTPPTTTELGSAAPSPSPAAPETPPTGETPAAPEPKPGETDLGAAPEGEAPAWAPYHGAPAEGEAYVPATLPDGLEMDTELFSKFDPIARKLNLSQAGVQELIDFEAQSVQARQTAWGDHTSSLRETARADPDIGGTRYSTETIPAANAAIKQFGTPAFREMLNTYGVGNHPEMIRFCRNVGLATREATATPGAAPAAQSNLTPAEKFYNRKKPE